MFRDLFAAFRRRNSARALNKLKAGEEKDILEKEKDNPEEEEEKDNPEEEPQPEALAESVEAKEGEEPPLKVSNTICLYEADEETKGELDLVEEPDDPRLDSRLISFQDTPAQIQERLAFSLMANPIFEASSSEETDNPRLDSRLISLHDDPAAEMQERFAFSLKANPILEASSSEYQLSEGCEESVTSEFTECTDAALKEDGVLGVEDNEIPKKPKAPKALKAPKTPMAWTSRIVAGFGWTKARVRFAEDTEEKNPPVLEPVGVVATEDDMYDIPLDDYTISAMAGKRGSFSSEISARTDESEGSEAKRARLRSVFRMRGGGASP